MAKKLLSVIAAVSMTVSTAVNLTAVSAQGGINVTGCSIANGSEDTNTAAIVLTFDGNVNNEDLQNAVQITDAAGESYGFMVTSKNNKAQFGINGIKKNTNYTLSIAAGADVGDGNLEKAFTRSFATGTTLYTSDWSTIGTNAEKITISPDWGGTFSETNDYLKLVNTNGFNYPLEQAQAEGIFELEYERYIPSYMTDNNGNPTETATNNPSYGMYDYLYFDNGERINFATIEGKLKITQDAWHSYKYIVDFDKKMCSFYLDGEKNDVGVDPGKTLAAVLKNASYVNNLRFQVGGSDENREMWIKNIRTMRKNPAGSWSGSNVTEKDGVSTITVKNNGTGTAENYYVLKNPVSGRVKVSFEFNANDVLKTLNKGNTGIRFYTGGNSGSKAHTVYSPYKKPVVNRWDNDRAVLNLPNSADELSSNEWHKAEYVFDITDTARTLVYAAIDGTSTLCNVVQNENALGSVAFFIEKEKSTTENPLEDNILQLRNINVIDSYSAGRISVTSNIEDGATVVPNDIKLTFSSPVAADAVSAFMLSDEDGELIDTSLYSFTLDDTQQVLSLKMNNYELNKTYILSKGDSDITGYLGGQVSAMEDLAFTTPNVQKLTGKWAKSYNETGTGSSMSTENGVTTFTVTNNQQAEQSKRESFAYTLDTPVTGTNVPLTVKYSFKTNEAIQLSESTMRFYPYTNGDIGGVCLCVDFPYSNPKFRWDGVTFNLPQGIEKLAANEWHTIEYAFNIDSTNGTTMSYAILDNVITFTNYTKTGTKQLQSMDVWFYGTAQTTDNYELQIKDLEIIKLASDFDVVTSNTELTAENNKIHLDFVSPVSLDNLKSGVKILNGATEISGAITEYALANDGYSAELTIGGINTTGEYTISFASLQDCYGRMPKTQKAGFTYTAAQQEGIVEITNAAAQASDSTVTVTAVLSNGKFTAVSGKLIAAAYNKDNKLVGIGIVDASLDKETSDIEKTVNFAKPSEDYSVRVMLWSSLEDMEALCNSYTVTE